MPARQASRAAVIAALFAPLDDLLLVGCGCTRANIYGVTGRARWRRSRPLPRAHQPHYAEARLPTTGCVTYCVTTASYTHANVRTPVDAIKTLMR